MTNFKNLFESKPFKKEYDRLIGGFIKSSGTKKGYYGTAFLVVAEADEKKIKKHLTDFNKFKEAVEKASEEDEALASIDEGVRTLLWQIETTYTNFQKSKKAVDAGIINQMQIELDWPKWVERNNLQTNRSEIDDVTDDFVAQGIITNKDLKKYQLHLNNSSEMVYEIAYAEEELNGHIG